MIFASVVHRAAIFCSEGAIITLKYSFCLLQQKTSCEHKADIWPVRLMMNEFTKSCSFTHLVVLENQCNTCVAVTLVPFWFPFSLYFLSLLTAENVIWLFTCLIIHYIHQLYKLRAGSTQWAFTVCLFFSLKTAACCRQLLLLCVYTHIHFQYSLFFNLCSVFSFHRLFRK